MSSGNRRLCLCVETIINCVAAVLCIFFFYTEPDRGWDRPKVEAVGRLSASSKSFQGLIHTAGRAEPNRTWPDRTELNRAERVTIHIASRADPNWKQCSWHFWTARMSNQMHVFSLMDNIWWRSVLFTRKRRFCVHSISCRCESFGQFYNLLFVL